VSFILELYGSKNVVARTPLDRFVIDTSSLADAMAQAKSIMRNVRFGGEAAVFCIIKNKSNTILFEVRADGERT
jgi:hypothetical protein